MRKIIAVLFISLLTCAQINELSPIPAFFSPSTKNAEIFIEDAKNNNFHPITYENYISGRITVPKHHHPFILFIADFHTPLNFVAKDKNYNLPTYHKDFDPVESIRVSSLSDVNFKEWIEINKQKELFTSNGKPRIIEYPLSIEGQLFTYASSDNMFKSNTGKFPFLTKKQPFLSKSERLKSKDYSLRGYHLSYGAINNVAKINTQIDLIKSSNLDAIVIDYKSYFAEIQKEYKSYKSFMEANDSDILKKMNSFNTMISLFKKQNIKVSLRIVVATDSFIQRYNSNLVLWNKKTNQPWQDYFGQYWVDLYSPEVIEYYKKIIRIATLLSPSEIQLDYIRFPSEGDTNLILARRSNGTARYKAVDNFCKEMLPIIDKANISFAVDIFGIVVWDKKDTTQILGQNILTFMRYADEICPMLYPSHFHSGFENIKAPGDMPYLFMLKGTKRFKKLIDQYPQYPTIMVPWIQAFEYMAPSYGPSYIKEQIKAINETGMDGFIAWNARNDYKILIQGLK
ncbi:MAG: hypothetical protein A2Y40_10870 [Candidatus Margulisbacteria bacterium GWF2_35_9]|nr:MAG: hypothetical protein A2Y40_10870 [Candidatus Margulisbacteria bacterium GWF2_35_9]